MKMWIYNENYSVLEYIELTNSEAVYKDMLGDPIDTNFEIYINREHRHVNIGTGSSKQSFPIIKTTAEDKMMNTWLKLERLDNNDLPLPSRGSEGSAGLDFRACLTRPCQVWSGGEKSQFCTNGQDLMIAPNEQIGLPLGFKTEFDKDYALLLYLRSSSGIRGLMLSNLVGVIDSDYRGELFAIVYNRTHEFIKIKHGDRVVQGIITPILGVLITEGKVNNTMRGEGGLGSTGS